MADEDDDFFGVQTGDSSAAASIGCDVEKLRRLHLASGFRDHADKAREAGLQSGFDAGFCDGAEAVARPAFWLGVAAVLDAHGASQGTGNSDIRRVKMELRSGLRGIEVDGSVEKVEDAVDICRAALCSEVDDCAFLGKLEPVDVPAEADTTSRTSCDDTTPSTQATVGAGDRKDSCS